MVKRMKGERVSNGQRQPHSKKRNYSICLRNNNTQQASNNNKTHQQLLRRENTRGASTFSRNVWRHATCWTRVPKTHPCSAMFYGRRHALVDHQYRSLGYRQNYNADANCLQSRSYRAFALLRLHRERTQDTFVSHSL